MNAALEQFRRLFGGQFEQLAGTHVAGELPLTDAVVNRLVEERLAQTSSPVTAVRVHAREGDALNVDVTLKGVPLISAVPVSLRVDQQPQLPGSPVLGLHWSLAGLGALARLAAPFISRMANLPPGIRIQGERVLVDIREALRAQGLDDVLRLVTRLEVHTRDGRIVLRFEVSS